MRHTKSSGKASPNMTLTSDTKCLKSQDEILNNQNNKIHLIAGLRTQLSQNGFQFHHVLQIFITKAPRVSLIWKACCCQC